VLLASHAVYLRRFGLRFRPRLAWLRERRTWELGLLLIAGAALAICYQANLVISLAACSTTVGAITAYTYAFFIISLLLGISSSSLVLVTLPDLVNRIAREGIAATHDHLRTMAPYTFAVLLPLLFAFIAYGKPLLEAVFGGSLSDGTIDLTYDIGLLLSVMAIPSALMFLTSAATLALGRHRRFLVVGAASVLVHAAIVIPLSGLGPRAVASGHIVSTCFMSGLLMGATFGRGWIRLALDALARSAPAFALASVFLLARLPLGSSPQLLPALAAAAFSAVAYGVLTVLLWPRVGRAFVDLVRRPMQPPDAAGLG
jgi:peptidoglycan biosynthesis protein MviN/MurJ (putative lipid II flippase)